MRMLTRAASLLGGAGLGFGLVALAPGLALSYPDGAPPSFDGFQNNCTACHFSFEPNSGTGGVTVDAPATFTPGEPVRITVRVTNTTEADPDGVGRQQGFLLGARDEGGAVVGSYDLGGSTSVRLTNNGVDDWVTHTNGAETEWTFSWIPPADAPPALVTLYVAGNAANGDGDPELDHVYTTQHTLALATSAEPTPRDDGLALGTVSPQPVRARAQAMLRLAETGRVVARLVDGRGRTVREVTDEVRAAGESPVAFRVDGLAAGMYFLVVEAGSHRRTGAVVVAR